MEALRCWRPTRPTTPHPDTSPPLVVPGSCTGDARPGQKAPPTHLSCGAASPKLPGGRPPQAVAQASRDKAKGQGKGQGKGGSSSNRGFAAGSGFGSKPAAGKGQAVDSLGLLRKSEQLYLRLLAEHHQTATPNGGANHWAYQEAEEEEEVHGPALREYVVCARACSGGSPAAAVETSQRRPGAAGAGAGGLWDWLPVAELLLVSGADAAVDLPRALPFVCREIAECVGLVLGASFPRHVLEFAYEGAESFYDEVLTSALGFGDVTSEGGDSCPYSTLGVPRGAPLSQIRAAYRAMAAQHHPDRHADEHKETAGVKFRAVTDAYDRIKTGSGSALPGSLTGSYIALGGPKREGLSAPLRVRPSKADEVLPPDIRIAVRPLDAQLVEVFLARIARRSNLAQTAA